ncbi:MAG: VanZ family protein [Betaproteobacteria bacterium]
MRSTAGTADPGQGLRQSPLARILLGVYAGLVVYASLYPWTGWRAHGLSPFAYLDAPWPRYVTSFDVTVNVLAYLPLGFLAVAALHPRLRGAAAFAAALAGGLALSLAMEAAQSYLPARVENNLDALCNLAGAAAGAALGVRAVPRLQSSGRLARLRSGLFAPGADTDLGLALIALWLFTQLNPAMLLFGAGDLRDLLVPPGGQPRAPAFFAAIEAATAAANLAAVALLFSALAAPGKPARRMFLALLGAALAVKTAAFALIMRAHDVLAWLTPGAQLGLVVGVAIALAAVSLPRVARLALAAMLLMAATVLVNLAPANPYLAATLKVWQQGHFLNFNGVTRVVSAIWPFAALGYLILLAARRR